MKNISKFGVIYFSRRITIFLVLLFLFPSVRAQEGIGLQLMFPSNPSPYLSDWDDGSMSIRLVVNNTSSQTYFVSFILTLRLDERTVVRSLPEHMPVEMIQPGVQVFEASDFMIYESYQFAGGFEEQVARTGKLPAGLYEICVQPFEVEWQQLLPGLGCQMVVVADQQPPRLIQPSGRLSIRAGEVPLFLFTSELPPVQPGSAMYPVTYRLVVMEIYPDQTSMDAFLSNMPVVDVMIEQQTRVFWPSEFELPEPGMRYVWNIQAIGANGNPIGQNEGWAEPKAFSITESVMHPPEFYNLRLLAVGEDGEMLRNASVVLYNREYPLGDHLFELPPGRHPYVLMAEGKEPRKGIIEVAGLASEVEVIVPYPEIDPEETHSDTTVHVARPAIPIDLTLPESQLVVIRPRITVTPDTVDTAIAITDPDVVVSDPDDPDVVVEPVPPHVVEDPEETEPADPDVVVTDPDEAVVVTEPATPPVVEEPEETEPVDPDVVVTDPDEAVALTEPATPPVVEDPEETEPADPDVVVTDPDADPDVTLPVDEEPPVTTEPDTEAPGTDPDVDPDDHDIPEETDPGLAEECVCTECSITNVAIYRGETTIHIREGEAMIVGQVYTFEPEYVVDCPAHCPQGFDIEITFSTYDFNGVLIADSTAMAKDKVQYRPRRSGNITITLRARAICGETVCDCGAYTLEMSVVGRTVADGVVSPVPGETIDPSDPEKDPTHDPDETIPPPVTGTPTPDPSIPVPTERIPPIDSEPEPCAPDTLKDPGLPIVLNVYLEENEKFLYPRAVPLHALGIDWDYAYFDCLDCDGSLFRHLFPVMDKVSTYRWRLEGEGSLNEPFTAREIMDLEEQIAALIRLIEEKEAELRELNAKIESLPDEIKAQQDRAKRQIEELEAFNKTLLDEIDSLQTAYDALEAQYDDAHQLADSIREEIQTVEQQIEDYVDQLAELEEKLRNHPTEEELAQMQEVENQREELELKTQVVWQKEQDIMENKALLQQDIQQALDDLETAIDNYNRMNFQIDTTQQEINRVLRQVYSLPVNRTLMERLREWNESANLYLIYLLDTLNLPYEGIVDLATVVNEVHRSSTQLIFTADTLQREQMGNTLKQRVDQFVSMAGQKCYQLPPSQPSSPCHAKVYWVSQRNRPYQNAVDSVVAAKPEFTAQQIHSMDSLRQALSDYEAVIESLRSQVEQRNRSYLDALDHFSSTMEQLEGAKADAIDDKVQAENDLLAEQTVLQSMINDRNARFAENEPGFIRDYLQTDSLKRISDVQLANHIRRLGTAMADSIDLHQEMIVLDEEMDKKRASVEANEQVIETLQKVVDIKPDDLVAELEDQKKSLQAEIDDLKNQLKQLLERVEELLEGDQKSAEAPMVYYIPPPLEVIMKDKERFEELKKAVAEAEVEYHEAVAFKASLQPKYAALLEDISRNLSIAKGAMEKLDDLEEKAEALSEALEKMEQEKEVAYNEEKEALESELSDEKEKMEKHDKDAVDFAAHLSDLADLIQDLEEQILDKLGDLAEGTESLRRQKARVDSLESVQQVQAMRLRALSDSIRAVHARLDGQQYELEAAIDQLTRAVSTEDTNLENQARNRKNDLRAAIEDTASELEALNALNDRLSGEHEALVDLLNEERLELNKKLIEIGDDLKELNDLEGELYLANKEFREVRQKMLEALGNSTASEALVNDLQEKANQFPSLADKLADDQELQDANRALQAAAREKQTMEDARDRSKSNVGKNLEERDRDEKEAEEKLTAAISRRDIVKLELRQFLLDEFNNVEFADTLYITAEDDVIDGWRSRDDPVREMAVIRYNWSRTPELDFTPKEVPQPQRDDVIIGSCEVDVATLAVGGISPIPSQVVGPEPRTIALIYKNGEPLWAEWPVIPQTAALLAESVVRVRAGGHDSDIFEHYCGTVTEFCVDPPPLDYAVADILDYSWAGDGSFFNDQTYSEYVLWEPKEVARPECDEEQEIKTYYRASTVVGDPQEETTSEFTVEPGIMIEVTDTLMGFPDHQRDAVARIVKGNYQGLPGEAVEFTVRLIEGISENWGFGGDTVYTATTDQLGYAKAPFEFGDGFARFEFDVRWIREEDKEPECETGTIFALSPLYMGIHYFGYSVDDVFLAGAKEIWEGADVEGVLENLPAPDEEDEKPLLAIAGLLDHNRDFVNEKDVHFSLKDNGSSGSGLAVDPETNTTELFGIAHAFVAGEVDEGIDLVVQAEPDEEYQPVTFPPKVEREFSTARGRRFKIGQDNDLFVILADEPFSPFEPVNGTGHIEVQVGGQVMMVLRDLKLNISDVLLEIRGQDTIAIGGRVSWLADEPVTMNIQNFSFGLDSLVLLPGRGGGLGGHVNHGVLAYPVGFYAEVGTDGDFYGEVMELPEIELADFKLHRGAHLVIDWSSERSPGGLDSTFKGIVIRQAKLDMPPVFRTSGSKEPSTLTAQDFAIGSTGVHGTIALSGAPLEIGYAGFELVGDHISLTFKDSEVESFDIRGIFRFPKPVEGGIVASMGKQGNTGWSLELETENPITIPKFKTTFALNSGTGVVWHAESETGTATINASVSSDYFSDIEIVGLEVNNKGLFMVDAINVDVGLTIGGGFDLRASKIAFSIGDDEIDDFVRVDGNLGISLIAESKIKGALVVTAGPNVDFIFEEASIAFERGPVEFKGSFAYNSREFRGDFDIDIKNMVGMKALLVVGSMPIDEQQCYSYWYAELVLKAVVPLGQSGLSLMELGGGLGYNYQPPIGSQAGMPVNNDAFALKALIAIGNSVPAPGKVFMGRMEMVLMPGIFTLSGKAWVLDRENSIFGEGQLNLRWEPETRVDGYVRSFIGLTNVEGKILRFNGKINYDIHASGFLIQSEEISGMVLQKVKGEASVLFTQQQIDMSGRVYYDASAEVDVVVATLKAHIHTQASGSLSYNNARNRMQASVGLEGNWGISADTFFGEINVFKGAVAINASVDASPQYIRFDANATAEWEILWHSGRTDIEFGFEI